MPTRQDDLKIPYGLKSLAGTMESQTRVTTSFVCKDKKRMDIRTNLKPTTNQFDLYRRLNITSRPIKRIILIAKIAAPDQLICPNKPRSKYLAIFQEFQRSFLSPNHKNNPSSVRKPTHKTVKII